MPTTQDTAPHYPLSRYLNAQAAFFPSFSSDGRYLSFISDITGLFQVWQVELADGEQPLWPEQLTFERDRVMQAHFSPAVSDRRLLYACDAGGNEMAQLFLLDPDAAQVTPLTAGYDDFMHTFGDWSPDGQTILFSANRRDPGLFDLYRQPLNGEAELAWQNDRPGFLMISHFTPKDDQAVVVRAASAFNQELLLVDLANNKARQLLPERRGVRYQEAIHHPHEPALLLLTDYDSDFLYVARLDLDTGQTETLVAPDWDVEQLALSPDGRFLAYNVNIDGASELHVLDLTTGQDRLAPVLDASPGMVAMVDQRLTFSPDSRQLAFTFTSATRTFDVFVWELESDAARAVTRSSHAGLPRSSFTAPELIHYPTFDTGEDGQARQIPAWFYRPKNQGSEPMPVVIIVHGGPEWQIGPYFSFLTQYLLNNGYAVLAPNVRGSTGYGKAYSHLDDVRLRLDSVADLAHANYWLREQPDIDGERIVVYGGSYGGYMVLAALTGYPDLWAAGVDLVGISNFVTFLENTSDYRRAHREAEYGSLAEDREFLESISPLNHVDKITAPLLIIHGANDPRVPVGEARQLAQALVDREVPVELLVFEDEGHGISKLKNKLVAYPAVVDFLEKHL